jgi:hypothetical protein
MVDQLANRKGGLGEEVAGRMSRQSERFEHLSMIARVQHGDR